MNSLQYRMFNVTLVALLTTLLVACAPRPTSVEPSSTSTTSPTDKSTKAAKLADHITNWEVSGAMAARNKQKGWTASFNWTQQGPNNYRIRLFGPLGSGTVLIERKSEITTYHDGKETLTASSADQLMQQKTGVALPVADLYYWIRGLSAPGAVSAATHDQANHLTSFQQAGYAIEYPSFMVVNGVNLPKQVKVTGQGLSIKVAIKQWQF